MDPRAEPAGRNRELLSGAEPCFPAALDPHAAGLFNSLASENDGVVATSFRGSAARPPVLQGIAGDVPELSDIVGETHKRVADRALGQRQIQAPGEMLNLGRNIA